MTKQEFIKKVSKVEATFEDEFKAEYNSPEKIWDLVKGNGWIPVTEKLPPALQTVWLTDWKGWIALGCLVEIEDGWHWAESNGVIYAEDGKIVSECESDDLDVKFWHETPMLPGEQLPEMLKKIRERTTPMQKEEFTMLLDDLMDEQEEIINSPIRFNGVHIEKIKQVFEKYGVKVNTKF